MPELGKLPLGGGRRELPQTLPLSILSWGPDIRVDQQRWAQKKAIGVEGSQSTEIKSGRVSFLFWCGGAPSPSIWDQLPVVRATAASPARAMGVVRRYEENEGGESVVMTHLLYPRLLFPRRGQLLSLAS